MRRCSACSRTQPSQAISKHQLSGYLQKYYCFGFWVQVGAAPRVALQRRGVLSTSQESASFRGLTLIISMMSTSNHRSIKISSHVSHFPPPGTTTSATTLSTSEGKAAHAFRKAGKAAKFGDRAPPRGNYLRPCLPEAFVGWLVSPSRTSCLIYCLLLH